MVAHAGFEPAISALRGRCPRPLDECALPAPHGPRTLGLGPTLHCPTNRVSLTWLGIVDSNHGLQIQSLPSYH